MSLSMGSICAAVLSIALCGHGALAFTATRDSTAAVAPLDASLEEAAAAIRALDTDHSGVVEKNEVEAFAKLQGLSAEQVNAEFRDLDTNGDGELQADEIGNTMKLSTAAVQTAEVGNTAAVAQAGELIEDTSAQIQLPTNQAAFVPSTQLADMAALPAVNLAPVAAIESADLVKEGPLMDQARRQAGRALAEVFARSASASFEQQTRDQKRASELDVVAKSLRGQAAELSKSAALQTSTAAAKAAADVVHGAESRVKELERKADLLEQDASKRREKAQKAMDAVTQAQAEMSAALHKR